MKSKIHWLLTIAVLITVCLVGWTTSAQKETPATNNKIAWEYMALKGRKALPNDQLNALGAQGWELIMYDDGQRGDGSYEGTYYFKRIK
jgi:hypothetical protein